MIYTSGTTGRPKGIERAHAIRRRAHLSLLGIAVLWGFTADDVHLVAGPLYHTGPSSYGQVHLLIGATVVVMPRFDAAEALQPDRAPPRHHRVHGADALQPHPAARCGRAPPPRPFVAAADHALGGAVSGARQARHHGGVPARHGHRVLRRLGGRLLAHHRRGVAAQAGLGRHARGRDTSCASWTSDGSALPPGEIGTIYVRGPRLDFRYRGADEKTRQAFRDGFFTAGDLGYLDADGYLFIADRRTDLIITGGANVYPAEVESVVLQHPAVADAAVIGLPDAEMGKSVARGRRAAPRPARHAPRTSSPSRAATSPTTSVRAASSSSPSCRASRRGRCGSMSWWRGMRGDKT